jgi:phosphoribosylformylglycinamidine synthase
MDFLHEGRPPVVRDAVYEPRPAMPLKLPGRQADKSVFSDTLLRILGSLNVASKEWVIRQYDHEVQGGSVIKPLVGVANDGPSDAAVLRPILTSRRGLVIACGMNPWYGDLDPYHMAASAIDEALRNCVAVGADPNRIALLDNFCWGFTDRAQTLGSLVRAALACHDLAVAFGTPFISGKDSLNNEFSYVDARGQKQTISIPPSLLISALGQIDDVSRCVTMDFKEPGNLIYQIGMTKAELGGSHFAMVEGLTGGQVPQVNAAVAKRTLDALHRAIHAGLVRACHDLSEGGLAVAVAEMALAGRLGAVVNPAAAKHALTDVPEQDRLVHLLFSESNSRFVCEVAEHDQAEFERTLAGIPHAVIGHATDKQKVRITAHEQNGALALIDVDIDAAKEAWQKPLRW